MSGFYVYDEDILTPDEVAEMLRCGMNSVYKLLNEKQIAAFRIGKTWRIQRKAVYDYMSTASYALKQ